MKLSLEYILKRKRTTLESFIKINRIETYEDLVQHCTLRGFIPVSEEDYQKINERKEIKNIDRDASSTQKEKAKRNNTKRKRSTQKLLSNSNKKKN